MTTLRVALAAIPSTQLPERCGRCGACTDDPEDRSDCAFDGLLRLTQSAVIATLAAREPSPAPSSAQLRRRRSEVKRLLLTDCTPRIDPTLGSTAGPVTSRGREVPARLNDGRYVRVWKA